MASKIKYLTNEEVVAVNKEALAKIKVKKADSFKVLSAMKIRGVLERVEVESGDFYDKAVVLIQGFVQEHPFASGNRRTAILVAIRFLKMNKHEPLIKEDAKILQSIRENYYTHDEIKEWLKGGDMREFKR